MASVVNATFSSAEKSSPAGNGSNHSNTGSEEVLNLYAPVPQIEGIPQWRIEFIYLDNKGAEAMLAKASQDDEFRNRPTSAAQVRFWKDIINARRHVNFIPDGALIYDEKNVLLNGKHRLTGLAEAEDGVEIGFMVIYGVPRWMFPYMGVNKVKTAKDVFYANYRIDKPQIIAATKMVLRYEEMLAGLRPEFGWRSWHKVRDQHADLDRIADLRGSLLDEYGNAMAVRSPKHGCKLTATSLMIFMHYQYHAWPEGRQLLEKFLDGLREGADLSKGNAALSLRNWGRDDYCPTEGKPYAHLMLLFRHFAAFAKDERLPKVVLAFGQPMSFPYHPDGVDAAKANLDKALVPLRETAST